MTILDNNEELKVTKKYIKDILLKNELIVKFKKKDGSLRTMRCTLQEGKIPLPQNKSSKHHKKINNNVISVYDLEKEAWRSFRVDSLKSFAFKI